MPQAGLREGEGNGGKKKGRGMKNTEAGGKRRRPIRIKKAAKKAKEIRYPQSELNNMFKLARRKREGKKEGERGKEEGESYGLEVKFSESQRRREGSPRAS